MNKVILIGRLTADPELRFTTNGKAWCGYTVAVDKPVQKDQKKEADFINCVTWGASAENLAKYMSKGRQIGVEGRLQTRSYDDKQGVKRYVTEVITSHVEFLGSGIGSGEKKPASNPSFGTEVAFSDEDLPF